MGIINPETAEYIKSCRAAATKSGTYEGGYLRAIAGLNAAIALIEMLQAVERESTLVIRNRGGGS